MVTGSDTVTVSIVALYNYPGQCDICLDFFFNCFCQVLNKKLVLQHNYLNAELNQPFKSNNKASRGLMVKSGSMSYSWSSPYEGKRNLAIMFSRFKQKFKWV